MNNYEKKLNSEKALIWRIVHRDNLPWILKNGLHCGSSELRSENWVNIGNPEIITRRQSFKVEKKPFGMLDDYVPFYFTPFSPMLYNIRTGYGVQKFKTEEIIILVGELRVLARQGYQYVFTDRHGAVFDVKFYRNLKHLDKIDWDILQERDFKRDSMDPGKFERYQAEALIYQHLRLDALAGIICYDDATKDWLENSLQERSIELSVHCRPKWYF